MKLAKVNTTPSTCVSQYEDLDMPSIRDFGPLDYVDRTPEQRQGYRTR